MRNGIGRVQQSHGVGLNPILFYKIAAKVLLQRLLLTVERRGDDVETVGGREEADVEVVVRAGQRGHEVLCKAVSASIFGNKSRTKLSHENSPNGTMSNMTDIELSGWVNCNRAEDAVACLVDCSPDDWRVDDACRPSPRGRRRVLRSVGLLTVCSSRSALPTSLNDFSEYIVSFFSSLVNPARFLCRTKDSASPSGVFIVKRQNSFSASIVSGSSASMSMTQRL